MSWTLGLTALHASRVAFTLLGSSLPIGFGSTTAAIVFLEALSYVSTALVLGGVSTPIVRVGCIAREAIEALAIVLFLILAAFVEVFSLQVEGSLRSLIIRVLSLVL